MFLDPFDTSKKPIQIFTRLRGDEVNRSETKEKKVCPNLGEKIVQEIAPAGFGGRFDQIDLIHNYDAWFVILLD